MPELRWALMGLGLLFLAGLALWEWRRSRRRYAPHTWVESAATDSMERSRRIEPNLDGMSGLSAAAPDEILDVPTIHAGESVRLGVSAESAVDVPAAARFEVEMPEPQVVLAATPVMIQWPPAKAARVLSLRVVNPQGAQLPGRALRLALDTAGLLHGPQKIYHQVTPEGAVLASVANLIRPGNFDPALMDAQEFRGLNVFSVLPGVLPPMRMLDELVGLARNLAYRMSAVVQDEHGEELNGARLAAIRRTLQDEAASAGDGTLP